MGLLATLKQNREEMRERKQERLLKQQITQKKAQAAYDIAFQKEAVKAVKQQAKKAATNRYGYTKAERRARTLKNFSAGMDALGNWAAGNTPSHTRTKHHSKKKTRTTKSRAKQNDPFDMGDLDNLLF